NLALVADRSAPLQADRVDAGLDGQLVAASGSLTSDAPLGDDLFLAPGRYLQLRRTVEMYAWEEERSSTTRKKLGGGSETVTTYSYHKEWTSDPENSSSFHNRSGHDNPPLPYDSATFNASSATIGAYQVDPFALEFPEPDPVRLNAEILRGDAGVREADYLLSRRGALASPQVGDWRISYQAVPTDLAVTLFGKAEGDRIGPFVAKKDTVLYRAFTEDRAGAIKTMDSEYTTLLWILRVGGFVLMWVGLALVFSPLNAVLNILPPAGSLSSFVIGAVTFVVALPLSIVTIVIAYVAHNLVLLIISVAIVLGVAVFLLRRRQRARAVSGGW
ncbi:MAG TPA: TMEM43 family protein, partial [Herpetosiphonaceae bacterium]